ncbi:MAG: septum formation initiator family protein [Bacteroidia bacterium]|nr:septum formation initiator family protein [Bacteroidia bacterium]
MKLKESWGKISGTGLFRIIKNKYVVAILGFAVWVVFLDSSSMVRCTRIKMNIREQENQKEYYREEIRSIEEKLNELSSNRDSLEKFAREQYLFKKDDEDLFVVEPRR